MYLVIAIQYSAIIYPYFDHLVLLKYLSAYYDGNLNFTDLFEPQAQTRPFVPRLIFLANAVLTKWDIRSEFVFIYATFFGTLAAHLYALRRLSDHSLTPPFIIGAGLISIFICSPVGNTNHWWSLMLFETLASMLITISLLAVSLDQKSWLANIVAAIAGWLAAYSLSNGLFVFPAIFAIDQIASNRPFKLNSFGAFWISNFILLCLIYIPGLPLDHRNPSISDIAWFFFVYLGSPLGSMLWFQFTSPFDLPLGTKFNGIVGVFLVGSTLLTLRKALADLRTGRPEAFLLFTFVAFAIVSAVVTAWGRAGFGLHGAQSPRYSTFAAFLIIGLIYYFAVRIARLGNRGMWHRWARLNCMLVLGSLLILSSITYIRAIPIYRIAHEFNQIAASAYAPKGWKRTLTGKYFPTWRISGQQSLRFIVSVSVHTGCRP